MTMRTRKLMSGVAAALLLSAGAVSAQTTDTQGQADSQIELNTQTQQGGAQTGVETQGQQGEAQTGADAQTGTETDTQAGQSEAQTGTEAGAEAEAGTEPTDTQQQTQETNVDVEITAEQETRIEQEIRAVDVDPIEVDFDVAIGVSVPGHIVLHPVPTVIVDVVPHFAGFLFFILVDGRIAIVHPDTHLIVAVI